MYTKAQLKNLGKSKNKNYTQVDSGENISKKSKKILMILSKEFKTDPRVYREAKSLKSAGYEITVIAWDRNHEYEKESIIEGVRVTRIRNHGIMKILPSVLFREPFWWRAAYRKALELYKRGYKFDIVHCHDLDTLQAGVWLKNKLDSKLIYDSHEFFFDYIRGKGLPNFLSKLTIKFEKILVEHVDKIITVSEPLMKYYKSITDKPVEIVMNCKDLIGDYKKPNNEIFTIVFIGSVAKERFFPQIVDIVGSMNGVKLIIAAKKENIWKEVEKRSRLYRNVDFIGTIPAWEVIPLTLKSDCVISLLDPTAIGTKFGLPNKIFEAMVCGRPIIATKGTYSGEIVEKLKCGITVEWNAKSVREGIAKLRDNPRLREELGKNGLKAAIERYNWEKQKEKLLKVYKEL